MELLGYSNRNNETLSCAENDVIYAPSFKAKVALAAQVRKAVIEAETEWQRIAATQDAVTSRVEELRVENDRYQAGRSTNLDLLAVQRLLIGAKVDEVSSRIEYIKALSALYASEGTLLQRRGVRIAAN